MLSEIMELSKIDGLKNTERYVLLCLKALISEGNGEDHAVSLAKLVEITRLSERSISRSLNTFRERNLISIDSGVSPLNRAGKIAPNIYKIK